jgi:asparagine synthase (glutamine-hydrolysing)
VLRSILEDFVPRALYERTKLGFGQPISFFLRYKNSLLIREYVDINHIKKQGLLNPTPLNEALTRFLAGDDREASKIWAVLLLQIFLKTRMGW